MTAFKMIKEFEAARIKKESELFERYLGMVDVDKSDVGGIFRRKVKQALGMSLDHGMDQEVIHAPNDSKLAKLMIDLNHNGEDFIFIAHGYQTVKNEDGSDEKKKERTIAFTNIYRLAKRIDRDLVKAASNRIYVIDDLTNADDDGYLVVTPMTATLTNIVSHLRSTIDSNLKAVELKVPEETEDTDNQDHDDEEDNQDDKDNQDDQDTRKEQDHENHDKDHDKDHDTNSEVDDKHKKPSPHDWLFRQHHSDEE